MTAELIRDRDELDLIAIQQSNRFNDLDDKGKALLNELIASREALSQTVREQQATTRKQLSETEDLIEIQHQETRKQIFGAVNAAATSFNAQLQAMRREIEAVNNAVAKNRLEESRKHEEIKALAQALLRAKTDKKRKKLQERSNLATEALCALISVYNNLNVSHASNRFTKRNGLISYRLCCKVFEPEPPHLWLLSVLLYYGKPKKMSTHRFRFKEMTLCQVVGRKPRKNRNMSASDALQSFAATITIITFLYLGADI